MSNNIEQSKKLGIWPSLAIYAAAGVLLWMQTHYLIPFLSQKTGYETIFFWFLVAGLGVFLPLIITGIVILKKEGFTLSKTTITKRCRFKTITKRDLIWSIGGLFAAGLFSGIIMKGLEWLFGDFEHAPSFMTFEPLTSGRYWLLIVWFPYWLLNILGEEFLWRGVMLPRQEVAFGKYTWIIHGTGWGLFHIAFGWQLLLTLMPLLYIQSFVVQKTQNSWTGVIMHGGLNGPSFIAIALGWI